MRRPTLNYLIDALAFTSFVLLVSTGILMHYILPPGQGHGSSIWGLGRHGWGDVHFWIAVAFLATLLVHFLLHWKWIVAMTRGRKRASYSEKLRIGAGAGAFAALLLLAAAPLLSPIERDAAGDETHAGEAMHREEAAAPDERRHVSPAGSAAGAADLRGYMTLSEVETRLGVPAGYLIERLHLPADVSRDTPLHDLRETHGFAMSDARTFVDEYLSGHGAEK